MTESDTAQLRDRVDVLVCYGSRVKISASGDIRQMKDIIAVVFY